MIRTRPSFTSQANIATAYPPAPTKTLIVRVAFDRTPNVALADDAPEGWRSTALGGGHWGFPDPVWWFEGQPPGTEQKDVILVPDEDGIVSRTFYNVEPGKPYGIAWRWPPVPEGEVAVG
jgi:hypothetical protein